MPKRYILGWQILLPYNNFIMLTLFFWKSCYSDVKFPRWVLKFALLWYCPSFYFFLFIYFYFWLCWVFVSVQGLSLVAASRGHSSLRCAGLSLSRPLPLWSTGSRRAGSVVVAHGPSCSAACGILPDQGSNPCPQHWQADSQPLRHQGSPSFYFLVPLSVRIPELYLPFIFFFLISTSSFLFYCSSYNNILFLFYGPNTIFYLSEDMNYNSFLFVCFWLCRAACGMLVPWPGIEPTPSAVRAPSPNHCIIILLTLIPWIIILWMLIHALFLFLQLLFFCVCFGPCLLYEMISWNICWPLSFCSHFRAQWQTVDLWLCMLVQEFSASRIDHDVIRLGF